MKIKLLAFFFLVFCGTFKGISQEKQYTNAPLKKVLLALEKEHKIRFSFSDDVIENKTITIQVSNNTSLEKILSLLQVNTGLRFQKITKRYIVVSTNKELGKSTLCGYVVDFISQKPLLGVNIITTSKILGTSTDEKGYFELEAVKETDSIKISLLGYKSIVKPRNFLLKRPCLKIELKEYSSVLDEILLTHYLTGGISKNTDGSEVITPKKLGILPGLTEPDVLQSLQLLPGIQSPNETASGIHIRGGTPDQNLILFDGIKMYNSAHFFGMISAFNPYVTKRVKIFKSGAGAEYGNHVSGVVDIETDDELPSEFSGGFGTNFTHGDAYLKVPLSKRIGVSISTRRSFTDFLQTTTFNKFSKKVFQNSIISRNNEADTNFFESDNKFYFSDLNTKITIDLSKKDQLILNQLLVRNKLNYQFKSNDNTYNTGDFLDIKNTGFRAKWVRDWNSKLSQKTSFYTSNYNYDYNYDGLFRFNTVFSQSAIKKNTIDDVGFKTIFENQLKKNQKLLFGYEFVKNKVNYNLERNYSNAPSFNYKILENNTNKTHAFFGEYVYKNEDKFTLHFGLRASNFSLINRTFLTPRIYTQVKLEEGLWLKSSLESKQQNISQLLEFDTADFGLENQVWALANNNNIPLLKSNQQTLGVILKKNNWTIDLEAYRKKIKGLTTFTNGINSGTTTNYAVGEGLSKGIDVLIQKRWSNYTSWISYSISNTDYTFESINSGNSFNGNYDAKHSFLWTHSLKLGGFNLSLGWTFRNGVPYTNANGIDTNNQVVYEAINDRRLPNYHKLDFSSTYTFNFDKRAKWKGKIGLSLLNIYNQNNVLRREFESIFNNSTNQYNLNRLDNLSLGFTPNMVFRVDF